MKYLIFIIVFAIHTPSLIGQDQTRLTDWSIAGIRNDSQAPGQIIDFITSGGVNDGETDNSDILQSIFSQLSVTGAIIDFGSGVFRFEKSISVPENVILRGQSADQTIFEFELIQEDDLIKVEGTGVFGDTIYLNSLLKDSLSIELINSHSFQKDDYIIIQEDDSEVITSSWAKNSTGQIVQLNIETDSGFELNSPLRRSYSTENRPFGRSISLRSNVGIESLTIRNLKQTAGQTSNILFSNTRNCWVKCIRSEVTNYAHVEVVSSTNLEISGSYFKDGFEYTGGGKAYGVMLHFTTGEVLVINNQFEHLRHSMIVQAGANGNVFAYNYSKDAYWEEDGFPNNSAGDLVLHGNYVYSNLFEGNIVQNIVIDASHGINGKFNTFFRNRAELYGIVMAPTSVSNGQNFIANEITSSIINTGFYAIFGTDHFQEANNRNGTYLPELTGEENVSSSLFIDEIPEYYENGNWPPIGIGTPIGQNTVKSKEMYESSQHTDCESVDITTTIMNPEEKPILIYPNPGKDWIYVEVDGNNSLAFDGVLIYDSTGKIVYKGQMLGPINISNLVKGVYTLVIHSRGAVSSVEKLMVIR